MNWRRREDSNPWGFRPMVFKTTALNHSATPPHNMIIGMRGALVKAGCGRGKRKRPELVLRPVAIDFCDRIYRLRLTIGSTPIRPSAKAAKPAGSGMTIPRVVPTELRPATTVTSLSVYE